MNRDARKDRLAAALRENLKRRKAQARARTETPPPEPGERADSPDPPAGQKPAAKPE